MVGFVEDRCWLWDAAMFLCNSENCCCIIFIYFYGIVA